MTDKEKLALIYRIVSGYTIIGNYIIDTPPDSLMNESLSVRAESIYKYRFEELLTEEDVERLLIRQKMWTPQDTANLAELDKSLDNCKLELYNNYGMPNTVLQKIRNQITMIKNKRNEQLNKKHFFDRFTLEGLGDKIAEMYVFNKTVLNKQYEPANINPVSLSKLISKYRALWPTNPNLRLVARTEPWRSYWGTDTNCFRILGDEQKVLILFSKMYDSVYEHSDRPVDNIINDDDMLDGWFLHMKKKNEEIRNENTKQLITQKHPKAGEIFLMVNNEEEAKEVEKLNETRAKIIKGKIMETAKTQELVRDKDILELRIGS
jgi:hypothetical protein